jgi:hypothetical protein
MNLAEGIKMRSVSPLRSLLYVFVILGLFGVTLGLAPASRAQFGISVSIAPPELPVYEQPQCPGEDYIWVPGYWAYDDDYYWVPGTWVLAPEAGYLWTPGYWGWRDNGYFFNAGYWGPEVGFYGGINYGYGYFGHGFEGGRWERGHFFYNRAVMNVNVGVNRNVYETRVNERRGNRVSFNGGRGGINDRADAREESAGRQRHIAPVAAQNEHIQAARSDRELHVSQNNGRPPVAATERPGDFRGRGAVPAREGGRVNGPDRPDNNGGNRPANIVHSRDVPQHERPPAPNTGNPKLDQRYQQQQQNLQQRQEQDHQRLQQRQDQDHQRQTQQRANDSRQQQMEQQHQRQTQQLEQKHTQQQQQIQQRQQPRQQQQQQQQQHQQQQDRQQKPH